MYSHTEILLTGPKPFVTINPPPSSGVRSRGSSVNQDVITPNLSQTAGLSVFLCLSNFSFFVFHPYGGTSSASKKQDSFSSLCESTDNTCRSSRTRTCNCKYQGFEMSFWCELQSAETMAADPDARTLLVSTLTLSRYTWLVPGRPENSCLLGRARSSVTTYESAASGTLDSRTSSLICDAYRRSCLCPKPGTVVTWPAASSSATRALYRVQVSLQRPLASVPESAMNVRLPII